MGCVLCEASTDMSSGLSSALSIVADSVLDRSLGDIASARSRLAAREAAVVAEIGRRKGNAREKLREHSRMSGADSRRTVETAAGLEELPATQDALAAGDLSADNARLLARSANGRRGTDTPVDEAELLPKAREQAPDKFAKTLRAWETFSRPDALEVLICGQRQPGAASSDRTSSRPSPTSPTTLLVIADLDTVTGQFNNGRLANGTPALTHLKPPRSGVRCLM